MGAFGSKIGFDTLASKEAQEVITRIGNELHKSLRDLGSTAMRQLGNRLVWATLIIAVAWVLVTYKPFKAYFV